MGTLLQIPLGVAPAEDSERAPRAVPAESAAGGKTGEETGTSARRWGLSWLAGGLSEISGPRPAAGLTVAAGLIREAQEMGEPAAWIAAGDSLFYAPDLHDAGIDLEALPLLRVSGSLAGARAAEHLLRSQAFGLVVLDLGRAMGSRAFLPPAAQVRLAALCRRHQAALLLLARKPEGAPPIADMASLRAEGSVEKTAFDRFTLRLQIRKDKRHGTGWSVEETRRGPDGLC